MLSERPPGAAECVCVSVCGRVGEGGGCVCGWEWVGVGVWECVCVGV